MSDILSYMNMLGQYLLFALPYVYILNLILFFLQIPCLLLGKFGGCLAIFIYTYFHSLYCAVCTVAAMDDGYSTTPLLIIFSIALFTHIAQGLIMAKLDKISLFAFICAIISIPMYIAMSFVPFLKGVSVVAIYLKGCTWILHLPILNIIFNFILPILALLFMLWILKRFILTVQLSILKFIDR